MKKALALLLLIVLMSVDYYRNHSPDQDPYLVTDYSRLHPVKVERVIAGKEDDQLVRLLREARDKKLTVSISGQRHSQAGATWNDVQEAVNRYGLAVRTMQSQNIFTVEGSISINAHGRDIRNGTLIESVVSYHLLTPC